MTAIALLVKAPRSGFVKTRLAADVGEACATAVYRQIGSDVARSVARAGPLTVWYAPADEENAVRAWLGDHEYRPQGSGDLGARMQVAVSYHLDRGDGPVVVIGGDCPGVTASVVREAAARLAVADVVLGPSLDGGYYLLGLNAPESALFRDIPWSTDRVLQITESRCRACHLTFERLSPLRDLDTAEDMRALGLSCP
jgi:rSAM/selenodomain-associated transferase 1